jgi:hypothetical protein
MFEQPAVTLRVKWAAANPLLLVPGLDNSGEAWDQEKSIWKANRATSSISATRSLAGQWAPRKL